MFYLILFHYLMLYINILYIDILVGQHLMYKQILMYNHHQKILNHNLLMFHYYYFFCIMLIHLLSQLLFCNFVSIDHDMFLYNFHITEGSTARAAGNDAALDDELLRYDKDGVERRVGEVDAGCYQYVTE